VSTATSRFDVDGTSGWMPEYAQLVFALVFVWGFGDAVSTLVAYSFTGQFELEANPFVRMLLAHEPLLVLVMKAVVVLVVGVTLIGCRDLVEEVPFVRSWLLGVTAVGSLIVVSNLYVGLSALV
jgi:hypothetical protein